MVNKHCKKPIERNRIQIAKSIEEKRVINLSGSVLTDDEHSILSKGLNFCPILPGTNKSIIFKEVDDLKRQLSLKVHFKKQNEEKNNPYKSTILDKIVRRDRENPWQPPHENCISAYTDAIKDEIQNNRPQPLKPNITKSEYEALMNLSNRTDIVIKKADKGSATVVCSSDWYENEALRQLSDTSFYKKVDVNNTEEHESLITNSLEQFSAKYLILVAK